MKQKVQSAFLESSFLVVLMAILGTHSPFKESRDVKPNTTLLVELDSEKDLSNLSFSLQYNPDLIIPREEIILCKDRFPHEILCPGLSMSQEKGEMVVTIADLIREKVMIKSGKGLLMELAATNLREDGLKGRIVIKSVVARGLSDEPVAVKLRILQETDSAAKNSSQLSQLQNYVRAEFRGRDS